MDTLREIIQLVLASSQAPLAVMALLVFVGAVGLQFARLNSDRVDEWARMVHAKLAASGLARAVFALLSGWVLVELVTRAWAITASITAFFTGNPATDPVSGAVFFSFFLLVPAAHVVLDFAAAVIFKREHLDVALSVRGSIAFAALFLFLSVFSFLLYSIPSLLAWARSGYRVAAEEVA